MSLALGPCKVEFTWGGDALALAVADASDYALAASAADGLADMQDQSPYLTGSLQSSLHAAVPGFAGDESETYDRRRIRDDEFRGFVNVYVPMRRYAASDLLPYVTDGAIWLGSWISYAYWVETGFYNVRAGRNFAGRYFIGPNAERALVGNFARHFNGYWAGRFTP